jgi:erythromycin esterase
MRINISILLIIITGVSCFSQNIKTDIQENISIIRTIDPVDDNFSDLEPIKNAIGNSRVVMLGEQDHGDAPTFLAKTRIVKYLHENMGFDIIAFESDFYGLNQVNQNLEELKQNIYPIWTKCLQDKNLFEYIGQQLVGKNPLVVTGFDCRHALKYSSKNYISDFDSLLISNNIPFHLSSSYEMFKLILRDIIVKEYQSKIEKENQVLFLNSLDTIQHQLNQHKFDNKSFWIQEISNLKGHSKNAWQNGPVNRFKQMDKNIRDQQMGSNLLWLIQKKYPDKKIIVWAHNFHIAKNPNKIEPNKKSYANIITAGNKVFNSIGKEAYIIGFNSYSGNAGRITMKNKSYKITKPKGECFENWINQKGYEFAFINFHNIPNKTAVFKMKGLTHYPNKGSWMEIYDGIFYIDKMYKCEKIE